MEDRLNDAHLAVAYVIDKLAERQDELVQLCSGSDSPHEDTISQYVRRILRRPAYQDHQPEFNFKPKGSC